MTDGSTTNELPATASDARSAVARTLASTLHVRGLLANVAAATRPLIPFERMGIALLEDADTVRSFLMIGDGADQLSEHVRSRAQCSDKLWPRLGSPPICIRDSAQELDTTYDIDRRIVEDGRRSVSIVSLEIQERQLGVLWFDARQLDGDTHD